jgi:hypothetical protein
MNVRRGPFFVIVIFTTIIMVINRIMARVIRIGKFLIEYIMFIWALYAEFIGGTINMSLDAAINIDINNMNLICVVDRV